MQIHGERKSVKTDRNSRYFILSKLQGLLMFLPLLSLIGYTDSRQSARTITGMRRGTIWSCLRCRILSLYPSSWYICCTTTGILFWKGWYLKSSSTNHCFATHTAAFSLPKAASFSILNLDSKSMFPGIQITWPPVLLSFLAVPSLLASNSCEIALVTLMKVSSAASACDLLGIKRLWFSLTSVGIISLLSVATEKYPLDNPLPRLLHTTESNNAGFVSLAVQSKNLFNWEKNSLHRLDGCSLQFCFVSVLLDLA